MPIEVKNGKCRVWYTVASLSLEDAEIVDNLLEKPNGVFFRMDEKFSCYTCGYEFELKPPADLPTPEELDAAKTMLDVFGDKIATLRDEIEVTREIVKSLVKPSSLLGAVKKKV